MQIQVHTDNHTEGSARLTSFVQSIIEEKLDRFAHRLTRVEVQLGDENSSAKGGADDHRCVIEARPNGMQPLVVKEFAATLEQAVRQATVKMRNLLDSAFEKRSEH